MIGVADVEFKDFTVRVKGAMETTAMAVLEEVAGELEAQTKRNTKVGRVHGGQLKSSWKHNVKKTTTEYAATVGSSLERAIWYEFGTGEYALEGNGRKGGWYVPIGSGNREMSEAVAKAYGFRIIDGKDGKKFAFVKGMKPQRPLYKAYKSSKNRIIKRIQDAFKGGLS